MSVSVERRREGGREKEEGREEGRQAGREGEKERKLQALEIFPKICF